MGIVSGNVGARGSWAGCVVGVGVVVVVKVGGSGDYW